VFDLEDQSSQDVEQVSLKLDSSHEIFIVKLRKAKLGQFFIFLSENSCETQFNQDEKRRRSYSSFIVFLFSQLPIGDHIPDTVCLANWGFLEILAFKVHHLEKSKNICSQSLTDAKFLQALLFDVHKSMVRFDTHENRCSSRQIDGYRYLSFAHQSHNLIAIR